MIPIPPKTKPMNVLILSKDRAMQLDATLHSLYIQGKDLEKASVTVLYRASTSELAAQYQQLAKYYPWVRFLEEADFRTDLIRIFTESIDSQRLRVWLFQYARLNGIRWIKQHSFSELILHTFLNLGFRFGSLPFAHLFDEQYWLLSVDDNLFIRPFCFEETINALKSNPRAIGFSLRLGTNINYCYMKDVPQNHPRFKVDEKNKSVISYQWENGEHDFGYPLEISSTIYRGSLLAPLLFTLYFTSPNTLESNMSSIKMWFAAKYPFLLCYSTSVSFCLPLNKVQQDRPLNRSSNNPSYSIAELATLFDQGKRIDIMAFGSFIPSACHQEFDLRFTDRV